MLEITLNGIIRLCIGAFEPNVCAVKIFADSNREALLGRWKRLEVNVGPETGQWLRIRRAQVTADSIDVGLWPSRVLVLFLTLFTGNCWVLLLYFFWSRRYEEKNKVMGGETKKTKCVINWSLALSEIGLKSFVVRPMLQIILSSLMQNSILTAALRNMRADLRSADPNAFSFQLNSVNLIEGDLEFDADARYKPAPTQKQSVGEMNLNFRLKTKVIPDPSTDGNGLLFLDPAVRTDFTDINEAVEKTLKPLGAVGRKLTKRFLPSVAYLPVGAACSVGLPPGCYVDKVIVKEDDGAYDDQGKGTGKGTVPGKVPICELSGRWELNAAPKRPSIFEPGDQTLLRLLALP